MSGRGQLVTLQLGQFANYVGAHFWNTQDEAAGLADAEHAELDAGVMYRQANGRVRDSRSSDAGALCLVTVSCLHQRLTRDDAVSPAILSRAACPSRHAWCCSTGWAPSAACPPSPGS